MASQMEHVVQSAVRSIQLNWLQSQGSLCCMHLMYTLQCTTAAAAWGPDEAPTDLLGFLDALRSCGPVLQKVAEIVLWFERDVCPP